MKVIINGPPDRLVCNQKKGREGATTKGHKFVRFDRKNVRNVILTLFGEDRTA